MTRPEFDKYFKKTASVKFNSLELIELKAAIYFEVLKGYHVNTWKEVCLEYITDEERGKRFPEPYEFKNMINIYLAKRRGKVEDDYIHSEEYKRKCESPEALAARRKFWETVAGACLKAEEEKEFSSVGTKFIHCLGEAVIAEPYEREKKAQAREVEK